MSEENSDFPKHRLRVLVTKALSHPVGVDLYHVDGEAITRTGLERAGRVQGLIWIGSNGSSGADLRVINGKKQKKAGRKFDDIKNLTTVIADLLLTRFLNMTKKMAHTKIMGDVGYSEERAVRKVVNDKRNQWLIDSKHSLIICVASLSSNDESAILFFPDPEGIARDGGVSGSAQGWLWHPGKKRATLDTWKVDVPFAGPRASPNCTINFDSFEVYPAPDGGGE